MQYITLFFNNFIDMFVDMAFYIMLGLVFVGLLNTYVKKETVLRHLGSENISCIFKASLVGVPLPLCSCGVVPTAIGLKKSGASNGATTSFLISTPQTGIDSILATYSLMGIIMAIFRPIAAFVSGILGGLAVELFAKCEVGNTDIESNSCGCGCGSDEKTETACCCHDEMEVEKSDCSCGCCHHEEVEVQEDHCGCCHHEEKVEKQGTQKLISAIRSAFGGFLDEMVVHFIIGLILSALIATFVPADFFVSLGLDSGILAMIAMILIGIPMYICSVGAIPIAISLIAKGLSYGAGFAFLFAGPVTNIASILLISKALGKKITAIYVSSMIICSVGFGLLLDFLIATFDFSILLTAGSATHDGSVFSIIFGVIFAVLVIKSLIAKLTIT